MAEPTRSGMVEANGAKFYYEVRGTGPSLMFIPGAEGDAAEYARVADLLEGEFTILSYDRRAFSRSQRPDNFRATSVEEQADDAAAILRALGMAPAYLWGNSSGAIISLAVTLRHPAVVRKAMVHEPPLFAGMSDPQQVISFLKQATANGKIPFMRMLMGDQEYEALPEDYRHRMEADDTWINFEFDNFEYYRPTDEELAQIQRPVSVLYGVDSPPFFAEAATWLAGRIGGEAIGMPGGHGAHYDHPEDVAEAIRSFMTDM